MKTYKMGDGNLHWLLIEEDDGSKKIATICGEKIFESEAKEYATKDGQTWLSYGSGSAMPYKKTNGKIHERWIEMEK